MWKGKSRASQEEKIKSTDTEQADGPNGTPGQKTESFSKQSVKVSPPEGAGLAENVLPDDKDML